MPRGKQARLILTTLKIILVPVLAFLFVTVRMMVQEQELSSQRQADEQENRVDAIQRELLARLTEIRNAAAAGASHRAIEFVAPVRNRTLVLPWDVPPPATGPRFQTAIDRAESVEFSGEGLGCAAYANAMAVAANNHELARARLGAARTCPDSREHLTWLLGANTALVDEFHIPWRLYAIGPALTKPPLRSHAVGGLREVLRGKAFLSPPAAYRARDLAQSAGAPDLVRHAQAAVKRAEAAIDLQERFAGLFPPNGDGASRWVTAHDSEWLAGCVGECQSVVAVQLAPLLEALVTARGSKVRLVPASQPGSWLGPEFPGLRIAAPEPTAPVAGYLERYSLTLAGVSLVLALALFSGWLAYRDVQREVELADMRSQFVASITHELRTPLTSIRMFAELLQMGRAKRPEKQQEYLHTIVQESERLTRLVEDVLLFARIERGEKTYNRRSVSPAELAETAARDLEYVMNENGLELVMDVDAHAPTITGDRDALLQAVLNLLSNAMKYSGDAKRIDLRVRKAGSQVAIEVADRGIGIPIKDQPHIFENFYRVQDREHESIPGTGIGLALVSQIVRAHNGEVKVDSAPGAGSTFTILLPAEARA